MAQNMYMQHNPNMKAWVAFSGETDLNILRFLREGFKHCFIIIHDGERWMSVDPLSNHMEIMRHDFPSDFDFPRWLENRGYRIERARIDRSHMKMAPVLPFTCVEAVKRFLGIHEWSILTPYQLYKYLRRQNGRAPEHTQTKEHMYGQYNLVPQY